MASAGELGVGQALLASCARWTRSTCGGAARMVDLALRDCAAGRCTGARVGVLGCGVQAPLRRHPGLPRARRGRAPCTTSAPQVTVYDPAAMDRARQVHPAAAVRELDAGRRAGADVLLLLTEWREFIEADPAVLGRAVNQRNIADGRRPRRRPLAGRRLALPRARPA